MDGQRKIFNMTGRPHYNHQTGRNGHNEVHNVSADEVAALEDIIIELQLGIKLAE